MEKKLLVVDDEAPIRNMLNKLFTGEGYTVILAESGEQALEIQEEENAKVMFLDLKLPGMDGIELCRKLKRENPISIAFAMTGYASLFQLSDCRDAGFDDYFLKPVDLGVFKRLAAESFEKLERWKNK